MTTVNTIETFSINETNYIVSNNKVCAYTFPYSSVYREGVDYHYGLDGTPCENDGKSETSLARNLSSYRFFNSLEGTMVRVWFNGCEWKVSTNNKINANESYWSSNASFEQLFTGYRPLDDYTDKLTVGHTFMFLLESNKDTQMVCTHSTNTNVYYVGYFDSTGKFTFSCDSTDNFGFPTPTELKFTTFPELIRFVNKIDYTRYQGVICFDSKMNAIKIVNSAYHDYSLLRDPTEPNYLKRFYNLYQNNVDDAYKLLNILSDRKKSVCTKFVNDLSLFVKKLWNTYFNRYVNKMFIQTSPFEHYLIKKVLAIYNSTMPKTRVTIDTVRKVVLQEQFEPLNRSLYELYPTYESVNTGKDNTYKVLNTV